MSKTEKQNNNSESYICLRNSANIYLAPDDRTKVLDNVLILGNINGMFGDLLHKRANEEMSINLIDNFYYLRRLVENKTKIYFVCSRENDNDKYVDVIIEKLNMFNKDTSNIIKYIVDYDIDCSIKSDKLKRDIIKSAYKTELEKIQNENKNMKFDYIIQNPPYNKTQHIDFFKKGMEMLSDNGKMVIIEPATWLINIRKDGNVKSIYKDFKKSIQNKISKVIVDNFNHELNTRINNSFSITYIDNSKNDDKFESIIFGNKKILNDIMFINYIEDYNNIWNIINKCLEKCDNIGKHVFDLEKKVDIRNNKKNSFIRICNIVAHYLSLVDEGHKESDNSYDNKNNLITYTNLLSNGEVSSNPLKKLNSVKKETDKYANCIVGTYQELTNWKHFCENNTLPLFINICMTIDQNNNSLKYVPWLVDKQYTDEEIYKMFNFTQQEINLIEKTIRKFEHYSPFFKRAMCGPKSVPAQEVQEFCDKLDKEYPTD